MFRHLAVVLFMVATSSSLPLVADEKKHLQMLETVIEDALGALIELAGSNRRAKKEDPVKAYELGEESDGESKRGFAQVGKVTKENVAQLYIEMFKVWYHKMPEYAKEKIIEMLARRPEYRSVLDEVNKVIRILDEKEQTEDDRKYLIEALSLHSDKVLKKIQAFVDKIVKKMETEVKMTKGPEKGELEASMPGKEELRKKVTKENIVNVVTFVYRQFSRYLPGEFSKANLMLMLENKFPKFKSAVDKLIGIMTKEKPNEAELKYLVDELSLHSAKVLKETQETANEEVAGLQAEIDGMKKLIPAGEVTKKNAAQLFSYIFQTMYSLFPIRMKEAVIEKLGKMGHGMEVVDEVIRIMTAKEPSEKDEEYLVKIYSLHSKEGIQGVQEMVDWSLKALETQIKAVKAILKA